MKPRVSIAGTATLLLSFTILPGVFFSTQTMTVQQVGRISASLRVTPLSSDRPFDYILIILMENKNFSEINGNPSAPYMNQLAHNYSLATQYTACAHPSLPNYMCLTGGNNYSTNTSNSSIVDRIESAGLTWKAYMEDMPLPCFKNASGNYTVLTDPFVYYTKIASNSTRCTSHVIPANSNGKGLPDDTLVNDLGSTRTASNYMWLTPNLCDNMHSCSISHGDGYLSKLVPLILNSSIFRTQRAALFITFDEGNGRYPTDYVYTMWAGPAVKTQYRSSVQYSHYSLPSTIETAWGLQPLTAKDGASSSMSEFFLPPPVTLATLSSSFIFSPSDPSLDSTVNFTGSATGGKQPYDYDWSFGDGNGYLGRTVVHSYLNTGNYTVSLTVVDASGQTVTATQAISIDTDPAPAGICQDCTKTTFPRILGLMISLAIGIALPLAGSMIISRSHRRIAGITETGSSR